MSGTCSNALQDLGSTHEDLHLAWQQNSTLVHNLTEIVHLPVFLRTGSTTRVKEHQDYRGQEGKRDRSQCEDQVGYYFTTAHSALLFDAFLIGLGIGGVYLTRPSSPG